MPTNDNELSGHRTRTNRWPNEPLHPPASLVVAVDAVYEALEDRQ